MRTVLELVNFPVDVRAGKRTDAEPTPEEQALVIRAYARRRWNDSTKYQPGDRLPLNFGYTFVEHRGRRWGVVHEAAILWLLKEQARVKARQVAEGSRSEFLPAGENGTPKDTDGEGTKPDAQRTLYNALIPTVPDHKERSSQ